MADDRAFAEELADLAASISLPRFRDGDYLARTKSEGSPVTDVDLQVEAALRGRISNERPDHEVVGEESGRSGISPWRWYLDPIDGTTRFVAGDPKWMTLIALAHRDVIKVGIVDLPAIGERWSAAKDHGAWRDGKRIGVSAHARLADAVAQDTWREDLARQNETHPLWPLLRRCAQIRPHRGHGMLAVACGEADLALQIGSHVWDHAPLKVIVEEAGGRMTDLQGADRLDTGGVVATNGFIHDEVLDLLSNMARALQSARARR